MCVRSERKREETRGQQREKPRGGMGEGRGPVRNVKMGREGRMGGGHLCVCVLTAGWSWEKLLWKSPEHRRCCCSLPPPDLHTHKHPHKNQLNI